jgi:hypothetical protein
MGWGDNSGRGRVQVQIRRALIGTGRPMGTVELAGWAYARVRELEPKHLCAVRRAAAGVAVRVGRRARGELVWALESSRALPQ